MRRLAGVGVLVTGAASGIGRALTESFAAAGARVVAADVNREAADLVAEGIRSAGGSASAVAMDVTQPESVSRARLAVNAESGPIAVLVNSAGTVHGGALLDVPVDLHLSTLQVNLAGSLLVTHAFLPDLIAQPEAHLVNIASASAFVGLPFGSAYGASKWGVVGFSESVRLELRELGHRHVGVTTVCPSYVRTGMFDGARAPWLTPYLTPARVAGLTLRAVRRRRPFVLAPWMVALTPPLRGLLPLVVFDRLARLFGVNASMATWRGRQAPREPGGPG